MDATGSSRAGAPPGVAERRKSCGIERVMSEAEQKGPKYPFRLRMELNVQRSLPRAMQQSVWKDAGQGRQMARVSPVGLHPQLSVGQARFVLQILPTLFHP